MFFSTKTCRIIARYEAKKIICNLVKNFAKGVLLINILLTLSGCDIAYQSSEVRDDGNANIVLLKLHQKQLKTLIAHLTNL